MPAVMKECARYGAGGIGEKYDGQSEPVDYRIGNEPPHSGGKLILFIRETRNTTMPSSSKSITKNTA